jgi:hypothetical protein
MQQEYTLLASGCSAGCSTPTPHAHPACAGFTQTRKRQRPWESAALRDSRLQCTRFRVSLCECCCCSCRTLAASFVMLRVLSASFCLTYLPSVMRLPRCIQHWCHAMSNE